MPPTDLHPTHPEAAGSALLIVVPETGESPTGRPRWNWKISQTTYDKSGKKVGRTAADELRTKGEALAVVKQQIDACAMARIELHVQFTDTTGDYEHKTYWVDGTADVEVVRNPAVPPARCTPLPTTKAETGARRAVSKPAKPAGQQPRRGSRQEELFTPTTPVIPPAPVPGVHRKPPKPPTGRKPPAPKPPRQRVAAEQPAQPAFVSEFMAALGQGEAAGRAWLLTNSRLRGPLAIWVGRFPEFHAASEIRRLLDEVRGMPAQVQPSAVKLDPILVPLAALSADQLADHIRGLTGREKQILSGKIRARGVPADLFGRWQAAMDILTADVKLPDMVVRLLAYADSVGGDPVAIKRWLRGLPVAERRGMTGAVKHSAVPQRARDLYFAARDVSVEEPVVEVAPPPPPPVVRPRPPAVSIAPPPAPPPTPVPPPASSKMDQYLDAYRAAVQSGTGASFLAGMIPVVRSKLRARIIASGDDILLSSFDSDVPRRPVERPAETELLPTPVSPQVLAHPVVVAPPAPLPPPPAPPPAPAAPSTADLFAGLTGALGQLAALGEQEYGAGKAESLRMRRFR